MNKKQIKQKAISLSTDALAIMLCCAMAHLVAHNVKFLSGAETIIAVCLGIWAYVPLKTLIKKEVAKRA